MSVSLGYTVFFVSDVPASLSFYCTAFGMEQRMLTPENDYGELSTGSTTLAFASNELASANLDGAGGFTPLDPASPPVGASITLLTSDVAGAVADAVRAGARVYTEPVDKPWGFTVANVIDPSGILVEIANRVAE